MGDLSIAKLARASWVHVAFAFLAMGGWAVFANRSHGLEHALLPGLIQGAISGAITFFLKRFLEAMSARLAGAAAVLVPPAISTAAILALLYTVHTLAGTPEVWATIAVPFAVSTTYAFVYTALIVRGRSREAA